MLPNLFCYGYTNAAAAFFVFLILEQLLKPIARAARVAGDAADQALPQAGLSLRHKLLFGLERL